MTEKLKFVLVCYEGLPEKEIDFVHKILKDFKKYGVNCLEYKSLSDCGAKFVTQLTDCCNETDNFASARDTRLYQVSYPHSLQSVVRNLGYEVKEGIILTSADNCSEELLSSGLTTVIFDETLGENLPYGFDMIVESFEEMDAGFFVKLWKHKNNIPCIISESKRTVLRELCEKDINEVIKISREEHVLKFVEDGRGPEEEQKEKLLAYIRNVYRFYDYGIWGIFDREDNSLIGVISLDLLTNTEEAEYETGFFIRKERLGQGFAAEGLKTVEKYVKDRLSASKLTAVTNCENKAAMALLKKSGFTAASQNDKIIFEKQLND